MPRHACWEKLTTTTHDSRQWYLVCDHKEWPFMASSHPANQFCIPQATFLPRPGAMVISRSAGVWFCFVVVPTRPMLFLCHSCPMWFCAFVSEQKSQPVALSFACILRQGRFVSFAAYIVRFIKSCRTRACSFAEVHPLHRVRAARLGP